MLIDECVAAAAVLLCSALRLALDSVVAFGSGFVSREALRLVLDLQRFWRVRMIARERSDEAAYIRGDTEFWCSTNSDPLTNFAIHYSRRIATSSWIPHLHGQSPKMSRCVQSPVNQS